jgi:hypothetical protein
MSIHPPETLNTRLMRSGIDRSVVGSTTKSAPSLVMSGPMRFLIMDAPRQSNLHLYIREMKRYNVTDLVRVCECTYEGADLRNAGIQLHEMAYDDGTSPPKEIISQWLEWVRSRFYSKTGKSILIFWQQDRRTAFNILQSKCFLFSYVNTSYFVESTAEKTIAVHCVAGLGRAPVLANVDRATCTWHKTHSCT